MYYKLKNNFIEDLEEPSKLNLATENGDWTFVCDKSKRPFWIFHFSFGALIPSKHLKHLYKTFPKLKDHKMSLATIRRMFEAPNKHFRASERHTGVVDARIGAKKNSYREYHCVTRITCTLETKCEEKWRLVYYLLTIWLKSKLASLS